MNFIIDSREKTPYKLPLAKVAKLDVGDYTVEGYEGVMAVERKGFDDLFSCLTSSRSHFLSQLERLKALRFRWLFVDATVSAVSFGHLYAKVSGEEALCRLTRLSVEYDVPVVFADDKGPWLAKMYLYSAYLMVKKEEESGAKREEPG